MIYQRPTKTVTAATYTSTDSDNGYRIIFNNADGVAITLHSATGRHNFDIEIDNIGAGDVTVSGQTVGQYQHAHIGNNGGTAWTVVLGGGGSSGTPAAEDVTYDNATSGMTATDVQAAIDELFQSVSDGKTALVADIETMGGTVTEAGAVATFAELSDGILSIPAGVDTSDATAVAGDILDTKTAYVAAGKVTGTMPNRGAVSITPGTSAQSIAAGYHNGSGTVDGDADLVATNIKSGANIFGVAGSYSASVVQNGTGAIVGAEVLLVVAPEVSSITAAAS